MLWRAIGMAGALFAAGMTLSLVPRTALERRPPTLRAFIAQGGLKDPSIPGVIEGWRGGPSPVLQGRNWYRVRSSDLEQLFAGVAPQDLPALRSWAAVVHQRAHGQHVLISGTKAVVATTSNGVVWIFAPRFHTVWGATRPPLRGFASEPGTGRLDCPCRNDGFVCVVRHADFLNCTRMLQKSEQLPFGVEGYDVYVDRPYPGIGQRFRYDNVLTAIKATFGERGY